MSNVRRVRPKKTVPPPKPIKIGSNIKTGKTGIRDAGIFERAASKVQQGGVSSGKLQTSGRESVDVDFKLSPDTGFRKTKDGALEIVTVAPLGEKEKKVLNQLSTRYHLETAKEALEEKGYVVEEKKDGESVTLVGKATIDGAVRTIEVSVEPSSPKGGIEAEDEPLIKIHALDFENERQCQEATDIVSRAIDGEVVSDDLTGEYAVWTGGREERKKDEEHTVIDIKTQEDRRSKGKLR